MTKKTRRSNFSGFLLILLIFFCINSLLRMDQPAAPDYSEIRQLFEQEKVEEFEFADSNTLVLKLRDAGEDKAVQYEIYSFELFYEDLNDLVQEQKAKGVITAYNYPPPETTNWLEILLPWILTALLLGGIWYLMSMRAQGGMGGDRMNKFGTARTRTLSDKDKKVTFDDVAGADEEKEELQEIVEFLK